MGDKSKDVEMSWNYRAIRKTKRNPIKDGNPKILHWYDIHEVYYSKKKRKLIPDGWTKDPILGGFESMEDLECSLARMLLDVLKSPVTIIKGKRLVNR